MDYINNFKNKIFSTRTPDIEPDTSSDIDTESHTPSDNIDNDTESDNTTQYTEHIFGSIISSNKDNTEHTVVINDVVLFCDTIKLWKGNYKKKKVKKTDENGNVKWYRKNRIEDPERTTKIVEDIVNNNNIPATLLSISKIDNEYYCWDGQHRRAAIIKLINDISCHDIIRSKFLLYIYNNDTEEGIINKFININKSVPVPQPLIEMIIEDLKSDSPEEVINNKIRGIANDVAVEMSKKFKDYCKTTSEPRLPNFNMHNIVTYVISYLRDNKIYDITGPELFNDILLINSNLEIKYTTQKQIKKIRDRVDKIKLNQVKCYLFVETNDFTNTLQNNMNYELG